MVINLVKLGEKISHNKKKKALSFLFQQIFLIKAFATPFFPSLLLNCFEGKRDAFTSLTHSLSECVCVCVCACIVEEERRKKKEKKNYVFDEFLFFEE